MKQRLIFEFRYLRKRAPWDTGISPPELLAHLDRTPPGRALDLGCGTGTNAIAMTSRGWSVTAVDISSLAIWMGKMKAAKYNSSVKFLRQNVLALNLSGDPFDLVLDIGCFHSLPTTHRSRYANNLARLLKPEGVFLLYTWLRSRQEPNAAPLGKPQIAALFDFATIVDFQLGHETNTERASAWVTMRQIAP
jgi:2-polyprenyl-3-methyl-5-hydroxy-6-metoxy-1,4-benzoquinol methylase